MVCQPQAQAALLPGNESVGDKRCEKRMVVIYVLDRNAVSLKDSSIPFV
jgi:hypothetical protein